MGRGEVTGSAPLVTATDGSAHVGAERRLDPCGMGRGRQIYPSRRRAGGIRVVLGRRCGRDFGERGGEKNE